MKTYKIDITRPTKKGSEVLKTIFVNSDLPENELANAYRKHYNPFDVYVSAVEVIDEKIDGGIIVENRGYSDPSHTIEYLPENKTLTALARVYLDKEAELKAAREEIGKYFGEYIRHPQITNVSEKSIGVRGYFKQTILQDRMPEEKPAN